MKSIEVEINGKMTPVYFAEDVVKAMDELREQSKTGMERLESYWQTVLESREMHIREEEQHNHRVLEHMATPATFRDDVCRVLRTCERERNPAPAYDFLRGVSAGWWLCNEINSPPKEGFEEKMREWLNKPKEEK